MDKRNINILKNSTILLLGNLSTKFIGFLFIPIYSYYFLPSDFGEIDLYLTISSIAYILFSFQAIESTFRFIQDAKTYHEKSIVLSNSLLISIFGFILFLVCTLVINYFLLSKYIIYFVLYVFSMIFSQLLLQAIRGMKKTNTYVILSLISALLSFLVNLLFIVYLNVGTITLLISPIISNIFVALSILYFNKAYKYYSFKYISKLEIINQLKFSLPLIPNSLSIWLLSSIGRFMLLYYFDVQAVGLLSFALKFPLLFESFIGVFMLAWQIGSVEAISDKDRDIYISKLYLRIIKVEILIICIILPALFIFNSFFVGDNFKQAINYIPVFFTGFYLKSLSQFLNTIFYSVKKTKLIFQGTLISAIVYFFLSLILVPKFYIYGVAVSYFISELTHFIFVFLNSRGFIKIRINIYSLLPHISILLFSLVTFYLFNSILVFIFLTMIFIVLFFIFEKNEFILIINILNIKIKFKKI